uniref:dolichyldiphosphatase 1-like n=1 Tax=Styela clava TaxID=7725 RepID=UPI00193A41AE|nr:dolichyldiphosphatase 1-like [Styela clava]
MLDKDQEMAQEETFRWKSISYTHVEYEEGDLFGKLLAWTSLTPIFIMVGFATHIYFRREVHTITYMIGQVLNELFNSVLKNVIKEPRPPSSHGGNLNIYGWPSAHSQFIWFFITYLLLFIYIRSQSNNSTLDTLWKHAMFFLCISFAICVSYSRVYLVYHTTWQVFCGGVLGSTGGFIWFILTQTLFTPLYPDIVNLKLSEVLLLRDSTLIPNIMWFEYTTSRQESRSRLRKMPNKVQ